jgi:hypothetical protein
MGGGGGGSKKKSSPAPPQAQPIDYGAIMAQASAGAQAQFRDQVKAQLEAYPKQEALQLGTVQNIASNLRGEGGPIVRYNVDKDGNLIDTETVGTAAPNIYTQRATEQLIDAADSPETLGRIGNYVEDLGYEAARDLDGTDIERELGAQALRDLQLGRALTPEQQRQATQAARAGMSARGLGVGNAAIAAEILNRDAYASQREAERRNFAGSTNQLLVGNRQNRIGTIGTILGQAANTRMNQANLGIGLAGANITIDPYARALAPGAGMGSSTLGQSGQMISNTWQGATQMAGNVASFNANMLDSRYNSWANNNAALQGAQMQAGATAGASQNAMMGSGMAAGGMVLGMTALAI